MNLLTTFRIRTKLTVLITFLLIGILTVGIIGYYYNNQSNSNLASMYNDNLLPVQLLLDTSTQAEFAEVDLLQLMLNSNISEQKPILDDIEIRTKTIDDNLTGYVKTSLDAYETENYNFLIKNMTSFKDNLSKSIELIKAGRSNESYVLFKTSGNKAVEDFQTNIRDLASYNTKLAQNVDKQNDLNSKRASTILLVIIAFVTIVAILLGLTITQSITKPILRLIHFIDKTSRFDLVSDVSMEPLLKYKDEVGEMVRALADMRKSLREMAANITTISDNLASHSEELNAATEENSKTIGQVVTAINELAEGNNSQAENINNTSTTMSDVVNTIGEVNQATTESAEHATYSLEMVAEGQKAVDLATERMIENVTISQEVGSSIRELGEMIGKVGSIVDIITSIAGQTNLLALNAAIEAARAGEAGRGFAVVSEEIRKLAEGSSSAAKEITQIIKETTEKSKQTADNMSKAKLAVDAQKEAVNVTKEAFDKIKLSVEDIVKRTQQSAGMLQNINNISKEIANRTQDMAAVAEQSAASTEEISASSEEQLASIEMIAQAASELSEMAVELNNEISKFKT